MLSPLWDGFSYKPHQLVGVEWMLAREQSNPMGGILCDEMGLGKTMQMVGLLKNSPTARRSKTLLVAPVAVLQQWKVALLKAKMTVHVPDGSLPRWRLDGPIRPFSPQVYMIGYELLQRRSDIAIYSDWDRVIYDEAHRLADSGGASYRVAQAIKRSSTWLLTATPIVNSIKDLRSLMTLVGAEHMEDYTSIELLRPTINRLVMSRTMDQLRATIPDAPPRPVSESVLLDFATDEEAEFYKGMTGAITKRWRALDADWAPGAALEKLKLFMRLRQLSLHPQIYIDARKKALHGQYNRDDWDGSSTKFDRICRMVETGGVHKWIVFCHFHKEMEMLKEMLEPVCKVQLYNGGMSAKEKEAVLEETKVGTETEVLLVQLQSGGTGLNLQHFDRIIFSGPWWTSALMEQAIGRAVRIGQTEVVRVYYLKLKEEVALNIDTYMFEKAAAKGALCRQVLGAANTQALPL